MPRKTIKVIALLLCFVLIFQQSGLTQVAGQIDVSGYFSQLGSYLAQDKFRPVHLRYLAYNPEENSFKLLLDKGDLLKTQKAKLKSQNLTNQELKENTKTLLDYFFIGLALPNESFWVNLRPEAEGTVPRFGTVPDPQGIIDPFLERTDIGRILLEADVQLKKDTARFTSPETQEGRKYWDRLYKKAEELFGTTQVTIPTLVRPWIVPNEIIIREAPDNAYIYKATLKVMLEEDYIQGRGISSEGLGVYEFKDSRQRMLNEYSSRLIRELIIPQLTKEVNSAKRYAPLRQVYYSLILAQWFKQRQKGQSLKSGTVPVLIDSRNLTNLTSKTPWTKTTYFQQYEKSFKEGEYNLKEQISTPYGQVIRTYVSGGISFPIEILQQIPKPGESFHNASSSVTAIGANPARKPASGKTIIGAEFDADTDTVKISEQAASSAIAQDKNQQRLRENLSSTLRIKEENKTGPVAPGKSILRGFYNQRVLRPIVGILAAITIFSASLSPIKAQNGSIVNGVGSNRIAQKDLVTKNVEVLIAALKDSDSSVRSAAAEVLGKTSDAQVVPVLIEVLEDKDSEYFVRLAAVEALGKIGKPAVPVLIETLKDKNREYSVRVTAAKALGRIGGAQVLPVLIEALEDREYSVRIAVIEALGVIGDAQALPVLIKALRHSDSLVRVVAVEALSEIGDAQALPVLIEALRDSDSLVRSAAAKALGRIGGVQMLSALIEVSKDSNSLVRSAAVETLGKIADAQTLPVLIEALKDSDSLVRSAAAEALGKIGKPAFLALLEVLRDSDSLVRSAAAEALAFVLVNGPEENYDYQINPDLNSKEAQICAGIQTQIKLKKPIRDILAYISKINTQYEISKEDGYKAAPSNLEQAINWMDILTKLKRRYPKIEEELSDELLRQFARIDITNENQIREFCKSIPTREILNRIRDSYGFFSLILAKYWRQVRPYLGHIFYVEDKNEYHQHLRKRLMAQNIPFDTYIDSKRNPYFESSIIWVDLSTMQREEYRLGVYILERNRVVFVVKRPDGISKAKLINPTDVSTLRKFVRESISPRDSAETYLCYYFPKITFNEAGEFKVNTEYKTIEGTAEVLVLKGLTSSQDKEQAIAYFEAAFSKEDEYLESALQEIDSKLTSALKQEISSARDLSCDYEKIFSWMRRMNNNSVSIRDLGITSSEYESYAQLIKDIMAGNKNMTRERFLLKVIDAFEGRVVLGSIVAYNVLFEMGSSLQNDLTTQYPDSFVYDEDIKDKAGSIYHFIGTFLGAYATQRYLIERYYQDAEFKKKIDSEYEGAKEKIKADIENGGSSFDDQEVLTFLQYAFLNKGSMHQKEIMSMAGIFREEVVMFSDASKEIEEDYKGVAVGYALYELTNQTKLTRNKSKNPLEWNDDRRRFVVDLLRYKANPMKEGKAGKKEKEGLNDFAKRMARKYPFLMLEFLEYKELMSMLGIGGQEEVYLAFAEAVGEELLTMVEQGEYNSEVLKALAELKQLPEYRGIIEQRLNKLGLDIFRLPDGKVAVIEGLKNKIADVPDGQGNASSAISSDSNQNKDTRSSLNNSLTTSTETAGNKDSIDNSVGSGAISQEGGSKVGGIDLRVLPIVTEPVFIRSLSTGNNPSIRLNLDLGAKWNEIQRLVELGVIPSSERLKEYVAVAWQRGEIEKERDKIICAIADILRLEEEYVEFTEADLKDILVWLEA